MSSSKKRKVLSFEDAQAISRENSQLRQQFALQCSQLADAVAKISTLPTSRQQAILGGLSSRDLSMFLVAAIGLEYCAMDEAKEDLSGKSNGDVAALVLSLACRNYHILSIINSMWSARFY